MGKRLGVLCECGLLGACLLIGFGCYALSLIRIGAEGVGLVDLGFDD